MEKGKKEKMNEINQAEILLRRDLEILSHNERVEKIVKYFFIITIDCAHTNESEVDQTMLWMVDLLSETFEKRIQVGNDLWGLNICLREIFRELPIYYDKYLYPKTKEKILRIILEQWDAKRCDDHDKEIFMFIWEIYGMNNSSFNDFPPEQRKIIDNLLKERIKDIESKDAEKWIGWIKDAEKCISLVNPDEKQSKIHTNLGRHFALARTRSIGLDGVWDDINCRKTLKYLLQYDLAISHEQLDYLESVCRNERLFMNKIYQMIDSIRISLKFADDDVLQGLFLTSTQFQVYLKKKKPVSLKNSTTFYDDLYISLIKEMGDLKMLEISNDGILSIIKSGMSIAVTIADENKTVIDKYFDPKII